MKMRPAINLDKDLVLYFMSGRRTLLGFIPKRLQAAKRLRNDACVEESVRINPTKW
jgi:hypothetical protein